jgi:hypothetical protein
MACLRIAMELGLFKKWKAAGGTPRSIDELLKLVSCDRLLFCEYFNHHGRTICELRLLKCGISQARVVCHLAATDMLEVVKPGLFGLTLFTSDLAEPQIASTVDLVFEVNGPMHSNLPSYIASINYQNPTDPADGNFKN